MAAALTLQIKRLEERLGTRRFQRNGRQTTVTEAGEVLLTYARLILNLNEEVLAKLYIVDTEGAVRVGVLEEVGDGSLPREVPLFRYARLRRLM